MKKIQISFALLFFVFFLSSCAINHQAKTQTSINNPPQDTYSEQTKNVDKAANQGDGEAEYNLGKKYYYSQDPTKSVEWFNKAAEQGHAGAQNYLGFMYASGDNVPQDYTKALKWFRKAAEQGDAMSQAGLGDMYNIGLGVSQDYTEAVKWYLKAAAQGQASAQNSLGDMYKDGDGVPQDYKEAVKWYLKAAEQENAFAQYNLGLMYKYGQGVLQDYTKALKWYLKAAEQGNAGAQYNLGNMYKYGQGVLQAYTKALKWYHKAAEQGNVGSQYNLALMYLGGQGVPQNDKKAAEWYRKAAEQGFAEAQYNLGIMYKHGLGVPQDYTKALKLFRKAAEQGDADARSLLGKLLEKTDYPGWEYLNITDTEYVFINTNKIRWQKDFVWYWAMIVPFQESHSGKKCKKNYWVADCGSGMSGLVSYIDYDSNGNITDSYTFKESEIDMSPVIPGSIGEAELEYACSHAKTGVRKKGEAVKTEPCSGTGWTVTSGFVVTNNHVVEGRNHIVLIRQDGVKIPATVAAHDVFNDLALLKVKDTRLLPAALPLSSRPAALGEKIVTVGYPHPDLLGVKPKLTEGVVNSTSGLGDDPRALQISVPIQAGNSGGPLVNMEGKVVGIVTSKVNAVKMFKWTGDLPQNINYGIKISYLQGLLSSVSPKKRIDTIRPFKYTSVKELAKKIKSSVLIIVAE